jgi:hypothetical protein
MAQMRKSAAKSVKVSSNVTVKAPKGKTISSAEEARLKNINKLAKSTKAGTKASAKALKASGKPKPKTDTVYKTFTNPNNFDYGKITARDLAKQEVAKRKEAAARQARLGGGGLRGGMGMGGGGGSGRSNVNR